MSGQLGPWGATQASARARGQSQRRAGCLASPGCAPPGGTIPGATMLRAQS